MAKSGLFGSADLRLFPFEPEWCYDFLHQGGSWLGTLFSELKRRNVVRVAIAYVVVSWVIMQIIDVVVEPLRLPDWTTTMVLVLLLIGLPLALFFSWAYELTPQGVKKTAEVDADASITPSTGRKLDRMIIVALVLAPAQ